MSSSDSISKNWSLFSIFMLSFTASASVSVMAPFFPTEAEKKGMSLSTAGYVFSVYGATLIVVNFFVGKVLPYIGNKVAFVIGIILLGTANIIFGLLEHVDDYTTFSVLCFVIRTIEAGGAAFVTTTCFMTIMKLFPENSAKQIAWNESAVSAGFMFGPVIGSAIFAVGGYSMPFIVLGAVVLINLPLTIILIRSYRKPGTNAEVTELVDCNSQISYTKLLKISDVFFVCVILFTMTLNFGSIESTLAVHLQTFHINPSFSGLIFVVPSAAYCLGAIIIGHFYAKCHSNKYYIIGLCLNVIGFVCIGPFSQTRFIKGIYVVVFALFLIGFACACVTIPTMPSAMRAVKRRGFEDDIITCSLVSGLWTTVYSFGYVVGPTFGALVSEEFGFSTYSLSAAVINLFVVVLSCFVLDSSPANEDGYENLCSRNKKCYGSNSNNN